MALHTAMLYRKERPPSDDTQHLPFILVADAVVKGVDRANPNIVSDKIMATCFMVELPFADQAFFLKCGAQIHSVRASVDRVSFRGPEDRPFHADVSPAASPCRCYRW